MHGAHALGGLAFCGGGEGLILTLFLTGLAGSLVHCGLMCGPLVLAQVMARMEAIPAGAGGEARRLAGALLLPYQAGRLLTYGGLGGLAATLAGWPGDPGMARGLGAALLGLAALLLAAQARPRRAVAAGPTWSRRLAGLLAAPTGGRGLLLGLALGLLPCGMVYAALAVAAASGDPWLGAAGMVAFGLGTAPMLVAIAALGQGMAGRLRARLRPLAPWILLANAGWLGVLAVRLAVGETGQ